MAFTTCCFHFWPEVFLFFIATYFTFWWAVNTFVPRFFFHKVFMRFKQKLYKPRFPLLAPQVRFERTTLALTVPRFYQLSYWGINLVADDGLEPPTGAYETPEIPLL